MKILMRKLSKGLIATNIGLIDVAMLENSIKNLWTEEEIIENKGWGMINRFLETMFSLTQELQKGLLQTCPHDWWYR